MALPPSPAPDGATPTVDIDTAAFGAVAPSDDPLPRRMATNLCLSFIHHEKRELQQTVDALEYVDRHQFAHLSDAEAREAATHLADALFAKDAVEAPYELDDGTVGQAFANADLAPVEAPLRKRGTLVGMPDPHRYATKTAEGWRKHKIGGDYWTCMMVGQHQEIQAAMQRDYPAKAKHGQSGYGPLPSRYIVGVELHDMRTERHWHRAVDVLVPYYEEILNAHG